MSRAMTHRKGWTKARTEAGYAALLVAFFTAAVFLPLCAVGVDTARWYLEIQKVQNAADAGATAGVTFLPDNFASAQATAIAMVAKNGYTASGTTQVLVAIGVKPTQLRVTVITKIPNLFGRDFGVNTATIGRTAVADFNGPAPMGSPCNTFGTEPPGTTLKGPVGSVASIPPGGAQCTSPQLWGAVAGPDTPKGNGDQYMTRTCSGNDGCTGTTNDEFDPRGYYYLVRVLPAAVGSAITLQIYDPAFVENGDSCEKAPSGTAATNNMNPYTTTDGAARYAETASGNSPNGFCTGDVLNGGTVPIVTSYDLRTPTDTYNPNNAAPINGCVKQYPGYLAAAVTTNALKSGNGAYNDDLAKVFHQWVPMCTFTPTVAGDYYLQIRTDVALNTSTRDGLGGYTQSTTSPVVTQAGDDTSVHGNGNNRFALRVTGAPAASVSVAGWQHMSIYANYTGAASTFNLVRVIPAAATKTLIITFFDVGDASQAGTITVLPPLDSNMGSTVANCAASGTPKTGNLAPCTLTNVSSATYNGRTEVLRVPIPNTYTCNSTQPGGCWFRVQAAFPSGLNDTTTWSAQISGDPVRLIE